jgi:3-methyladenine DNA glycosylase/8-oxoguanine DNA glycosylase
MTPDAYRKLARASTFTLALPAGFRTDELFAFYGRDSAGTNERVAGSTLHKALMLEGAAAVLTITFTGGRALCTVTSGAPTPARVFAAHACVARMLNLEGEPADFEARARRTKLAALVARRPGLRVPCTATPFEALVWTIVGQQVNVEFAATLRQRVIARYGVRVGDLRAHPTPEVLADAGGADLRALQFSVRKAEYLQQLGAAVARGDLDLGLDLATPAPRLYRRLVAQRGLGPWSASYALLRGFGFLDCAPADDVGLQTALQRALALKVRPDASATARLLSPYAPWRSLATYHLWASLADEAGRRAPAPTPNLVQTT